MNIDIGLPPIATLLIALLVLAIISDFLLELYSIRMSQSTGRLQNWFFDQFGQTVFVDFLISLFYQLLSFRKKAFFLQLSSLVNVGSFSRRQNLLILLGSQMGLGLSALLLMPGYLTVGMSLCGAGFLLSLLWKDQLRDLGMGMIGWGLFLTLVGFFDLFLAETSLNIHNFHISENLALVFVLLTTLFFRTPVAFLLCLGLFQLFVGINIYWFPCLFLVHSLLSLGPFYGQIFQDRKRLVPLLVTNLGIQLSQFACTMLLALAMHDQWLELFEVNRFLDAFQLVVAAYFIYQFVSLLILTPFFFLLSLSGYYHRNHEKKGNQKIINIEKRGNCFSIHLSLFLLRQEFKKYTTSVHTIFKISRESDYEQEAINHKFMRYQGMLVRVGDELKELCFCIGRQRSYRWQVKEIMSYYKIVNQLELLVDDLSLVTSILREKDLDEEWEKECRFWLGLQLKLFESFFHYNLGVGKDDPEKVKANIERSYDILDRFFVNKKEVGNSRITSQTFYRITESIGSLAL